MAAGEIYTYPVTGRSSSSLIDFIIENGSFYDIFMRLIIIIIIIGVVIYYRKKHNDSSPVLWALGAIIFGAWILILLGLVELFNSYEESDKNEDISNLTEL